MVLIQDIKVRFFYIGRMLKVLYANDKKYLLFVLINIILQSCRPFILMYLAKSSIDMLTTEAEYSNYLFKIGVLLVLSLAIITIETIITYHIDVLRHMFGNILFENVFNKTMELDYDMLLDKEILEKQHLARQLFEEGSFAEFVDTFNGIVTSIIILVGTIFVVARIDLWIIIIIFILVFINSKVNSAKQGFERNMYERNSKTGKKIQYFRTINADFSYGKEIRLYNMRNNLNKVYKNLTDEMYDVHKKTWRTHANSRHIQNLTSFVLEAMIYSLIGFKALISKIITVGDFSLFLTATITFNSSLQKLVNNFVMMGFHGKYLKDYFDYLDLVCKFNKGTKQVDKNSDLVFIFENVSFIYPHQTKPSLKNINLKINPKEKISIVGENGAGKTTLIKLLLRLYDPTEGRILLNNTDIKEIDYINYHSLFSSVFQDYKIFAFKLYENITSLHNEEHDSEKHVKECIFKAGLNEKIDSLSKGVDSYLYSVYDSEGIELSGGESQKLAIARALYKDAPIVILDEPTSALDPRAEYEIYQRFNELVSGKASIYISHRLSSTRFCDRVIVLKEGSIIEDGSHYELMNKNGNYKELYDMQAQFYIDSE